MDQEILEPIITPLGDVLLKPLTVPRTLAYTYPAPGIYTAAVWLNRRSITGAPDTGHRFDVVIDVFDEPAMDALFTQMWDGMHDALGAEDISRALQSLTPLARLEHQPVLEALLPYMHLIVPDMSPLRRVWISPVTAAYAVNQDVNGENRIVFIYFIVDSSGLWQLTEM